jgi:xanthine dehydrogenase YagS FAD-binding subunit
MLPLFTYVRARSVGEAVTLLGSPGARVHAGGTDLLGCLRDGVFPADTVVSLSGLDELRGIRPASDGGLRIGALTSIAEVAANTTVKERYAALGMAASLVASPQLRNQGTLGGNLCQRPRCWYFRGDYHCTRKGGDVCYAMSGDNRYHAIFGGSACFIVHPSDTAPALVALGASLRIQGAQGERLVPADAFFVGPDKDATRETVLAAGELVTEILLPAPPPGAASTYRKVRARQAWDFALAGAAVTLTVHDGKVEAAKIVLSGVAPIPWRVPAAEQALIGRKPDPKTIAAAATAASAKAMPLDDNGYKVALVRGVVSEALDACLPPMPVTPPRRE